MRVETASHLETKKEGECECECLGVKKFQMVRCSIFFVLADGSKLGDAGSDDGELRHLETEKEGEYECECLGVKKFKMVRCNGFFVVADGSELGMLAVVMTG